MAKDHVLEKLIELKQLNIETLMTDILQQLNSGLNNTKQPLFKVAFNLSDDLKGAWTNRFTTDYDNKFKLNALVVRNFCTPIFWTSENYSTEIIVGRTLEYCHRTIYWLSKPNPETLADHILQEAIIAKKINAEIPTDIDVELLDQFYQRNKTSSDYSIIFNFLYGDDATASLGNKTSGIKAPFAGFKYAAWLAKSQ